MTCPNCGTENDHHLVPVWQDRSDWEDDEHPDYVGCTNCHHMHRPELLRGEEDDVPPQAKLNDREVQRLPIGNQHSEHLSIIEWQCVKGAAIYYGVTNWIPKTDPTLTAQENVSLMEKHGYKNKSRRESSLRQLVPEERYG